MDHHHRRRNRHFRNLSALTFLIFSYGVPADTWPLERILGLLQDHSPSVAAAASRVQQADGAMMTARQYPNPEFETGGGASSGLGSGSLSGYNAMAYLSQPLDLPFVREARREVAEAGIVSAEHANKAVWQIVQARTRQAFFDILRREAELAIALDNQRLLEQIRDKVGLKVEVGEAARYEIVKADAELSNAVKLTAAATIQVEDAKSALRALFAGALPREFEIYGELPATPETPPNLDNLRQSVLDKQPLLRQARAEVQRAEAQLNLEQQQRYPVPTLKAGVEHDPGLEQWRVGISLPLPLWNQRQGQIAEAQAGVRQSEAEASQTELALIRELENAYNRYQLADRQVKTFESALLQQAEKALQVAEAAYRLGERGILDYLDAQRIFRSVRSDYQNARFDRINALIDLERLNGDELDS